MDGKIELSFEEAWAAIELMDVIKYDARDNRDSTGKEYAAIIPICKPGQVRNKGYALIMDDAVWAAARTWYYHYMHGNHIPHKTKEQAKKDIRRRFKSTYKTSPRFRKAVNEFLTQSQGDSK